MNNKYTIQLDKNQLISLIHNLTYEDKIDIIDSIKRDIGLAKSQGIIDSLEDVEITSDEIVREVKIVRKERYQAGKHAIDTNN